MIIREVYSGGKLMERYDGNTSTVTTFALNGSQTGTRPMTASEIIEYAQPTPQTEINRDSLRSRVQLALATNKAYVNNGSPTNAEVAAQVKFLTRECDALIRLLINSDFTDVI